MRTKFRKLISGILVMTMLLTTVMVNVNITFAEPTNTKDFLEIGKNNDTKVEWRTKTKQSSGVEGQFSSFASEKSKALVVNKAYGYKLYSTDNTTVTVTDGATSAAPSEFNGDKLDPELTDNMKKWKWFDLSKASNTAGNIEIKISNLSIYQPDVKNYIKVDVVRTVTKINTNSSMNGKGWVALGKGLSDTIYIGVDEVTTRNTFYEAGTDKKISLKTNLSVADIDVYQYVAVSEAKIVGQYVSDDTDLYYGEVDGKVYYASRNDTNYSGDACSYVAFTFEGSTFSYTFGRYIDIHGAEVTPLPPTNQYQYLGSGQNMFRIPPDNPTKKVNGPNATRVEENELRNLREGWTYYINQPTPTDVPEKFYYDTFEFQDDVDTCLDIEDISIWATDVDGVETDVTNWFSITKKDNKVRASMQEEHLKKAASYQKVFYEMRINVRWHVPDNFKDENAKYMAQWKAHGHYNSTETILEVGNEATVEIDQWVQDTNKTNTITHLSTDEEGKPGLAITKDVNRYEHQVGDVINYTVKVWNTNPDADTAYF